MAQSNVQSPVITGQAAPTHEGSAPMYLTGRALLVAWIASIMLHVTGLTLMLFLVFPFTARRQQDLPITRIELVGDPDAAPLSPSLTPDASSAPTEVDPLEVRFTPTKREPLSELASIKKPELSIIGIGAGGGADFSDYGLTAGRGPAPDFFGLGSSARGVSCVVYVVDKSGSMLDTFIHVHDELKRSISALRRSQKFHVIFFSAGVPLENLPRRPVAAIQAQKTAFFEFLDGVVPEGSTHPEQAMRRALALEPDLVYFLTDGEFDPDLLPKLDGWNRDRRVRIFTIAYFDESGAELLEKIAREHGGEFKFVSEDDIP